MQIRTSKMSKIIEVDVATLEARGPREVVAECKETMMQVVVLNAITMENQAI